MSSPRLCLAALALTTAGVTLAADPPDWTEVTFADGFTVRGPVGRESEFVEDGNGRMVKISRADGFDFVTDGPKFVIFSTNSQRGGKVDKAAAPPPRTAYKTRLLTRHNNKIEPHRVVATGEFDAKWVRRLDTRLLESGESQPLTQQVTSLDPYTLLIESPVEVFAEAWHTTEIDPKVLVKLLTTHPDLRDPAGGPDPVRRLKVASFLKEVADADPSRRALVWLQAARRVVLDLKRELPEGQWPPAVKETAATLAADIGRAEIGVVISEVEAAVRTGRYDYARSMLGGANPAGLDEALLTRLTVGRAAVERVKPGYELTTTRLRAAIDRATGAAAALPAGGVVGGPAVALMPRPAVGPEAATLAAAATQVLSELSPDTADRLELFRDAAGQADAARGQGRSPMDSPAALLAYAVSGWVRGKNGADADVPGAVKAWAARELVLDYLRLPVANDRKARLDAFVKAHGKLPAADDLAQLVTLLPPAYPADVTDRRWRPVPAAEAAGVSGVIRANTGPVPDAGNGVEYVLRLPPEYHPGRAYPVVIALTTPGLTAEDLVARLSEQAEKGGYIVAAPVWTNAFGALGYDYTGKNHHLVTATLRDVLRRFQADPDKVFLFGIKAGADFAVDLGMAHPDLFAGVGGFCPAPPAGLAVEYWANAQRLPMYLVAGEAAGTFPALRRLYDKWMRKGFPALLTVYKGRHDDWYAAELPRLFDWMSRKTRVRGAASLRLGTMPVEPWQVLRDADDRFYWVGVGPGGLKGGNRFENGLPKRFSTPAHFSADIGRGGSVVISNAVGVKKFVIWLDKDLIDWTAPLDIKVNGTRPPGFKPKKLDPDIRLMLEELHRTGDRKMLYLGKIEFDYAGG